MTIFLTRNLYFRKKNSCITPFKSQFLLSHASNNTTFRNIGVNGCMVRPPPSIRIHTEFLNRCVGIGGVSRETGVLQVCRENMVCRDKEKNKNPMPRRVHD